MRYQELKSRLKDFPVFSLADIRKIEASFHRRQLSTWVEKKYIKKIRRGHYMFSDTVLNEEVLFLIANRIYTPSYVSFESALSYYGLIPEGVYSITSACGRKTARFRTPIAEFTYRKIRPELLFGYNLQQIGNQRYKIAEIEKAVLDYLYLNPAIARDADFYGWRFNSADFLDRANIGKLRTYAEAFQSKALLARLEQLIRLIQNSK